MRQSVLKIRNKMLHSLIKLVYLLGGALFSHTDVKQALTLQVSENRRGMMTGYDGVTQP